MRCATTPRVLDGFQLYTRLRRTVVLNAQQTPRYSDVRFAGDEGGDFVFVPVTVNITVETPAADAASLELAFWDSIKASTDAEDYQAYLRTYPTGQFVELAKVRSRRYGTTPAEAPSEQAVESAALAPSSELPPGKAFRDCPSCPEMIAVPTGSFMMGSSSSEVGRYDDEGPLHSVSIASAFAIGKYEVTFAEWDACVADNGCSHRPDDEGWGRGEMPVMNVSWQDAKQCAEWLTRKTGHGYRLPSEAEWEYAARARSTTAWHWGTEVELACRHANIADQTARKEFPDWVVAPCVDSHAYPAPVGSYAANAFGLHDIHGNVWEWV